MSDLPTGTVTFLYTDLEGSTRLWERDPQAMKVAVSRHDAMLHQAIEGSGGVVFRTQGDGLCAAFATTPQAVAAALSAQRALQSERWGDVGPLRVRMALHAGAVEVQGGDYVGSCLNRIGRLLGLAHGGQVLVSQAVFDLAADALPEGASLRDLGEQRLRDLTRLERVYQLCHPELPADFPALRALDAFPNNLPLQLTSFVGREREIEEVKRLLGTTRLITITGTGGAGKTRLAYQVAAELLGEYPDGVWVAELASLSDPGLAPQAVASALGVREQPGRPILETLLGYLKPKRLLLVLDNCEHLLEASASLAEGFLLACPRLRILTTSREMLGVNGEVAWRVPSMATPDLQHLSSTDRLDEYEAVRLFVERARLVQPTFQITERNSLALAEVCTRLDGIPLAIELAAARTRGLTVEQINGRLGDRFGLLTGGRRTALRRQQTLRATIDWSYDLLSPAEKVLFRRLSVFAGGWTLEAAEEVCQGEGAETTIERTDVLDLLLHLVDRSLVVAEEVAGDGRYRLLETIRQYAASRLDEVGEAIVVRNRHRDWFTDLTARDAPEITMAVEVSWLDRLEIEHDNLRSALAWDLTSDPGVALRLATRLAHFWNHRGYLSEGRRWLDRVLSASPERSTSRAVALGAVGVAAWLQCDFARAREVCEESLAITREVGDIGAESYALIRLGYLSIAEGDLEKATALLEEALLLACQAGKKPYAVEAMHMLGFAQIRACNTAQARRWYEQAIALAREVGMKGQIGHVLGFIGHLTACEGDYQIARDLLEESLRLSRESGYRLSIAWRLLHLGNLLRLQGELDRAEAMLEECLALSRTIGFRHNVDLSLGSLAYVARGKGLPARAMDLLAESLSEQQGNWSRRHDADRIWLFGVLFVERGDLMRGVRLISAGMSSGLVSTILYPADQVVSDAVLETARKTLGEEAFARAWADGQAMTLEEAVEYALGEGDDG